VGLRRSAKQAHWQSSNHVFLPKGKKTPEKMQHCNTRVESNMREVQYMLGNRTPDCGLPAQLVNT
jgi:hypothetical protein